MKRDHTVYILGAGFSRAAGVPVVADFLDRVRSNYEDPDKPALGAELEASYKRVLDYRHSMARVQDYVNLQLDNIEVLFSLLEMDAMLGSGGSQLVSSMKHVISHAVSADISGKHVKRYRLDAGDEHRDALLARKEFARHKQPPSPSLTTWHLEMNVYSFSLAMMLGLFRAEDRRRTVTFISLNYDTVLEQAAWDLGLGVDYGSEQFSSQSPLAVLGGDGAVRVLKLHGSSNWVGAQRAGAGALVYSRYDDFGPSQSPLVMPPTWTKGKMSRTYRAVWKEAAAALREATSIIVIGYSLPIMDQHVRHLLTSALSENMGIHSMLVVDNDSASRGMYRKRYSRLFKPLLKYRRLEFDGSGFPEFFRTRVGNWGLGEAVVSIRQVI